MREQIKRNIRMFENTGYPTMEAMLVVEEHLSTEGVVSAYRLRDSMSVIFPTITVTLEYCEFVLKRLESLSLIWNILPGIYVAEIQYVTE